MSTPKRPRVESQAHLTNVHIPAQAGETPYEEQIVAKVEELFAAEPEQNSQLIGIDLMSFVARTDEKKLIDKLKTLGYSYQVVRFGGKTGKDTGVLIKRLATDASA